MARYYMHLRDGTEEVLDPDGVEHATLGSLQRSVLIAARDVIKGDVDRGMVDLRFRIDAEDGTGSIVHTLAFTQAIKIIPATHGSANDA